MEERYYVDERVGCIAVRDRTLDNEEPGLHSDTTGVVKYWHGVNTPEFGGWGVPADTVLAAHAEALRLNNPPKAAIGSRWTRGSYDATMGPYNGYTVRCITNTAHTSANHPPQVVYEGDNGHMWSLQLDKWPGSLVPEDKKHAESN